MFNKLTLIGRLGKDVELRYTQTQKAVANFTVCTSEKGKDGKESVEWHNVVAWEKTAENCKQYSRKGSLVFVEGKLASRKFVDKSGAERTSYEVTAAVVRFLTPKPVTAPEAVETETPAISWDDLKSEIDSIPF